MQAELELIQIDNEMEATELNQAKDQLHDLLNNHPNDLSIRAKLGEVYWALEEPEIAGRYWFLIEASTPEMVAATFAFVTSCDNQPQEILRNIEFNGDIGELDSEFAKYMLVNLKSEVDQPNAVAEQVAKNQAELEELILPLNYEKTNPVRRAFLWAGCVTAMVLPFVILGGVVFGVGRWVFGAF